MPKKSNLEPVRTKDEARKRGANGGVKSGQARREKKLMREALQKRIGASLDCVTQALIDKAANGDVRAYEVIRDTLGEKPTDKIDHTTDGNPLYAAIVPSRKSLDDWIKDRNDG